MTKEEHINHWLQSAEDDLKTLEILLREGSYTHALFFGHLYLEKFCKAVWVKNNEENSAPRIHNLLKLLNGNTKGLNEDDLVLMDKLNEYQLEGRYPEYTFGLQRKTTKQLAVEYISRIKTIAQCLRNNL